jgi:hypothetical protein
MGSVKVGENLTIQSGRQKDVIRLGINELPVPTEEVAPTDIGIQIVDRVPGINLPLDVLGRMRVDTGGGDDEAWFESVHVSQNMHVNLGAGNDLLSYDWGAVSQRIVVDAGGGDDLVALVNVAANRIAVRARSGNDGVGVIGVATRQLNVQLGAGNDEMLVSDTSANSARFNGGSGIDSIDFQGVNYLPRLQLLSFEIIT